MRKPSFGLQIRARLCSLLPFLYQTRILLSEPKTARGFYTINDHVNNYVTPKRTLCSTSQRQAYTGQVRRPNNDPIVFVDTPKPQKQNRTSPPSTVTAAEQAVFDRLIKEVSQPPTSEPDEEDILDQDEQISRYDPNVDLNRIFEEAILQLRNREEQAANSAAKSLLLAGIPRQRAIDTLVADGKQALSAKLFTRPLKLANSEKERVRLEMACDQHRSMVMRMLDDANSDVEIWQVLEEKVFSLVTLLGENTRLTERAKKKKSLQAAKVRKAGAQGKYIEDVELEKADLTKREMSSIHLSHTEAIPYNNLVSILHRNYAEYCLSALRLLRTKYPTSFYAPHVLSTIKQRGPISYVLGVSTEIYNEMLFLMWTQYSDLHGMADLMEEMLNQGIEGNEVTVALIKGVARLRRTGFSKGLKGPVVREWWAMRGTMEGWRRVHNFYMRMQSELTAREAMSVDEAGSEEGKLETDKE